MSDTEISNIPQDKEHEYAHRYRVIWQAVNNLTKESDKKPEEEQVMKEIARIDGKDKGFPDGNYKAQLCWAGLIDYTEESLWELTEEGSKLNLDLLDKDLCKQIRNNLWKEMKKKRLACCKVIIGSLRALGDGISVKDVFEQVHRQLNLSDENLGITDGDSPLCGNSKFKYLIERGWEGLFREGYLQLDDKNLWSLTAKGEYLKSGDLSKGWANNIYTKKTNALNLALTYKAIWEAACKKQYVTHTELANVHGRPSLHRGIASHLDRFMKECYKKNFPILGVMVVADDDAKGSGYLTPGALVGAIKGARRAGYHEAHLLLINYRAEQKKIFKWAETALPNWNDILYEQPHESKVVPLNPQSESAKTVVTHKSYTVQDIIDEGCFLEKEELEKIKVRWTDSKNLILQGPPGTGKTWLAKRLGKALIGSEDPSRIRVVQFHPSTSYEDFVLGYRPRGKKGKLRVKPGVFLQMATTAAKDENKGKDFVLVIEEINRGRPAQIFGELLTLIENTKRREEDAMQLTYHREGQTFYVPDNLYIIGTMNLADRSLAMVDMALRRRFAFYDLKPQFGKEWKKWCRKKKLKKGVIDEVGGRMIALNEVIKKEPYLGEQLCVGHSYVTPEKNVPDAQEWFNSIVESKLKHLLEGYSVNKSKALENAIKALGEPFKTTGGGEGESLTPTEPLEQPEKAGEGEGDSSV